MREHMDQGWMQSPFPSSLLRTTLLRAPQGAASGSRCATRSALIWQWGRIPGFLCGLQLLSGLHACCRVIADANPHLLRASEARLQRKGVCHGVGTKGESRCEGLLAFSEGTHVWGSRGFREYVPMPVALWALDFRAQIARNKVPQNCWVPEGIQGSATTACMNHSMNAPPPGFPCSLPIRARRHTHTWQGTLESRNCVAQQRASTVLNGDLLGTALGRFLCLLQLHWNLAPHVARMAAAPVALEDASLP